MMVRMMIHTQHTHIIKMGWALRTQGSLPLDQTFCHLTFKTSYFYQEALMAVH